MSDMSKPQPGPYSQQPTAPVYQAQPGYGPSPGYQGPPPQGYQGGAPPTYGTVPPGYQPVPAQSTTHVYVRGATGNCPACGVGDTHPEFTILGIVLAILFFPIGILCCLMLTERRCSNCGMTYS